MTSTVSNEPVGERGTLVSVVCSIAASPSAPNQVPDIEELEMCAKVQLCAEALSQSDLKLRSDQRAYMAKCRVFRERGLRTRKNLTPEERANLASGARSTSSVGKAVASAKAFGGPAPVPNVVKRKRPPKPTKPSSPKAQPASSYADIDLWLQEQELIGDMGTGETRSNCQPMGKGKGKKYSVVPGLRQSHDTREYARQSKFMSTVSPQVLYKLHSLQREYGRNTKDASLLTLATFVNNAKTVLSDSKSSEQARQQAEHERDDALALVRETFGVSADDAIAMMEGNGPSTSSATPFKVDPTLTKMPPPEALNPPVADVVSTDAPAAGCPLSKEEGKQPVKQEKVRLQSGPIAVTKTFREAVTGAAAAPAVASVPADGVPPLFPPKPVRRPDFSMTGNGLDVIERELRDAAAEEANEKVLSEKTLHPWKDNLLEKSTKAYYKGSKAKIQSSLLSRFPPPRPAPLAPSCFEDPPNHDDDPLPKEANAVLRGIELKKEVLKKIASSKGYSYVEHTTTVLAGDRDDRLVCNRNINMVREAHQVDRIIYGYSKFRMFIFAMLAAWVCTLSLVLEYCMISSIGYAGYFPSAIRPIFGVSEYPVLSAYVRLIFTSLQVYLFYKAWRMHSELHPTRDLYMRYGATMVAVITALKVAHFNVPLAIVTIIEYVTMFQAMRYTRLEYFYSPHALSMLLAELRASQTNSDVLRTNAYMHARRLTSCLPISDKHHNAVIDGTVQMLIDILNVTEPDFSIGLGVRATFRPVPVET